MAKADIGLACDRCLDDLIQRLVLHPDWHDVVLAKFADHDVTRARLEAEHRARQRDQRQADLAAERRAAEREATAVHVVYYVRTGDRTIKIGTTGHLEERMRAFRVANPDNLLAAEPGSYERETERHAQFAKWRYHRRREDFSDAEDVLDHITALRAEHGDPWAVGGVR